MDNFFFGLQGLSTNFLELVRHLTQYELFWGFSMGFLVSTIVQAFLMSDDPFQVPRMVFQDKAKSFQKIHKPDSQNRYHTSYVQYASHVNKLKMSFILAGGFLLLMFLVGLLTF